jgi:transcriptional regulator
MRHTPHYLLTDPEEVRRLIREHPWGTFVSHAADGLVASHYPIVLEEPTADDPDAITIVSHVGRPDEVAHELGRHELLLIVQGPHGYISPGWYPEGDVIPTWNHVTAHLWGTPELLEPEENYRVLGELVDRFEAPMPEPRSLELDEAGTRRVARGTVGLRLRVTRFDARAKLSQNRPPEVRERIMAELRADGPYAQPALADEMARVPSAEERRAGAGA